MTIIERAFGLVLNEIRLFFSEFAAKQLDGCEVWRSFSKKGSLI